MTPMPSSPAKPPSDHPGLIRQPRQIRALISPVRQEIADAVHAAGPVSISQLAGILGRPADALYFHVRMLEGVGLLRRTGTASTGRRAGAVYDVCARPLMIKYDISGSAATRSIVKVSASMLRLAHRDFARAFSEGLVRPEGQSRNTWSGRAKGWLTEDELAQVNRSWKKILELLHKGRPRAGATLHAATFIMTPLREKKRAKPTGKAGRRKDPS